MAATRFDHVLPLAGILAGVLFGVFFATPVWLLAVAIVLHRRARAQTGSLESPATGTPNATFAARQAAS